MIKKIKNKIESRKLKKAQAKEQKADKRKEKEEKIDPSAYDEAVITWLAPEYIQYEKGIFWKISMAILTLALIILGLYLNAWTFSLAIGAFAVVYVITHFKKPEIVEVKLSDIGVKIGNRTYPYSGIQGFWMNYQPPFVSNLHLKLVKGGLISEVVIFLNDQNPVHISRFLSEKIPEIKGRSESVPETLTRFLKL